MTTATLDRCTGCGAQKAAPGQAGDSNLCRVQTIPGGTHASRFAEEQKAFAELPPLPSRPSPGHGVVLSAEFGGALVWSLDADPDQGESLREQAELLLRRKLAELLNTILPHHSRQRLQWPQVSVTIGNQ